MNSRWLIGCGIAGILGIALCAGVGVIIFRAVIAATQPVVDASEEFLTLLAEEKFSEAYASTASGLKARLDEPSFTAAVKKLGLTDYSSAFWNSREINNQEGKVGGTMKTKNGGTRAVVIQLVMKTASGRSSA